MWCRQSRATRSSSPSQPVPAWAHALVPPHSLSHCAKRDTRKSGLCKYCWCYSLPYSGRAIWVSIKRQQILPSAFQISIFFYPSIPSAHNKAEMEKCHWIRAMRGETSISNLSRVRVLKLNHNSCSKCPLLWGMRHQHIPCKRRCTVRGFKVNEATTRQKSFRVPTFNAGGLFNSGNGHVQSHADQYCQDEPHSCLRGGGSSVPGQVPLFCRHVSRPF